MYRNTVIHTYRTLLDITVTLVVNSFLILLQTFLDCNVDVMGLHFPGGNLLTILHVCFSLEIGCNSDALLTTVEYCGITMPPTAIQLVVAS